MKNKYDPYCEIKKFPNRHGIKKYHTPIKDIIFGCVASAVCSAGILIIFCILTKNFNLSNIIPGICGLCSMFLALFIASILISSVSTNSGISGFGDETPVLVVLIYILAFALFKNRIYSIGFIVVCFFLIDYYFEKKAIELDVIEYLIEANKERGISITYNNGMTLADAIRISNDIEKNQLIK